MNKQIFSMTSAVILALTVFAFPAVGRAQQATAQEDNGIFVLGSILFSIIHVPLKLATCVGTQTTAAAAYTVTYGVTGNYDGGTNGKAIWEDAPSRCTVSC